jgi:hypothetical protein
MQQHYQLRTKTYYLILKEKILLKIKNPTQKTLSIWNFNIITKTFVVSDSDCRLLKRRQYFLQICFIVNNFRARIVLRPFLSYDSYQLNKSFSRVFECVLYYFYLSFTAYRQACLSDNGQIYFLPIKMNGNVASSPIENNFLPIIDRWSAVISSPVCSEFTLWCKNMDNLPEIQL